MNAATKVQMNIKTVAALTLNELHAADTELTRRAALLGKAGQVSKSHQAVRDAIAARSN